MSEPRSAVQVAFDWLFDPASAAASPHSRARRPVAKARVQLAIAWPPAEAEITVCEDGWCRPATTLERFALAWVTIGACIQEQAQRDTAAFVEANPDGASLETLAEVFGCSREHIYVIETRALLKMYAAFHGMPFHVLMRKGVRDPVIMARVERMRHVLQGKGMW